MMFIALLILLSLVYIGIMTHAATKAMQSHLKHLEYRLQRLEAMQFNGLIKLGYKVDDLREAYPRIYQHGEPVP